MIQVERVGDDRGAVRFRCTGPIATEGFDASDEPMQRLAGEAIYAQQVLLDLSGSDFISSSGLGWLLVCHKRFQQHGGKLVIVSPSRMILQMLRMMKLDSVLHVAATDTSARELLGRQESQA